MGSRDMEKMQKAKRRLQAITFLTNISLDGSYKDTGWGLEHAKVEAAGADNCRDDDLDPRETDGSSGAQGCLIQVEDEDSSQSCPPDMVHYQQGHIRATSADAHFGLLNSSLETPTAVGANVNGVANGADVQQDVLGRKRANTTQISDAKLLSRGRRTSNPDRENVPPPLQRHAHFSSNESVEHPTFSKSCKISNTNISENSFTMQNQREVKVFNLRENPPPVIKNERLIIVVNKRTPVVMFSTIPYSKSNRPAASRTVDRGDAMKRSRNPSGNRPLSALSDPDPLEQLVQFSDEEVSYGYLLKPSNVNFSSSHNAYPMTHRQKLGDIHNLYKIHTDSTEFHFKHPYVARCISYESTFNQFKPHLNQHQQQQQQQSLASSENSENQEPYSNQNRNGPGNSPNNSSNSPQIYHAQLLDDPELRAGKHRTLLTFPSYMTSVIDYCKPSDLKKELNDKFKERFPQIQLSLSKLRSLKREMRKVAKTECNIDLLTVAHAYVYFEKLILQSFITKFNRKYCSGACLLLSAKLNDIKGENLHTLIEKIETVFRVNKKDLISYEFAVLVALEFALHVPTSEVSPHYQRLLYES